jgi:RES domain
MIIWRLLPLVSDAPPAGPGGALWFARELQGAGRHDNPSSYGCLYGALEPVSAVAEALAPFRGTGKLSARMLLRGGLPLTLVQLRLADDSDLVDLDSPRALLDAQLRPSQVATHVRTVTQAYAQRIFDERPGAAGLLWWSTLEASLINVTLFDRAARRVKFQDATTLTLAHPAVVEAGELLGFV